MRRRSPAGKAPVRLGVETIASTPEQFGAFMAAETERWGKLIREAGLNLE